MTDWIDRAADARRYTCSIIGRPPISTRALPGRRDDWYLAGMTAIAETKALIGAGPELETGGTNNLNTTARGFSPLGDAGSTPRFAPFENLRTALSHVKGGFALRPRKE